MSHSQFSLLRTRRFLPLFLTQALGAFNDNVFKNAIVVLITYMVAVDQGSNTQVMVAAVAALFILPFFLFSATAGQLADKYDKAFLIRTLKTTELVLMGLASIGFVAGSTGLLMVVVFLMGAQSAFFGPLKYGILPDHLREEELIGGNGLVQAATFLAILLGTMTAVLIRRDGGDWWISIIVVGVAVAGWAASRAIPPTVPAAPGLRVDLNFMVQTWRVIHGAARNRDVFLSILGISWFWFVGSTFLVQFPTFTRDVLGGDEVLMNFLIVVFSVGIGIGSLLCNTMLKGQVHATFVPLGALGITVFSVDLYFATSGGAGLALAGEVLTVGGFLSTGTGWRIVLDLLLVAVAGGVYIVPLNTIVQDRSDPARRARNIAANNILNAALMVLASLGVMAAQAFELTEPEVFLYVAMVNAGVALYITRLLPGALVKGFVAWLLQMLYRVEVDGIRHYREAGDRVLIVSNHQSYLDAVLIAAYLPDDLTFAINTYVARHRLLQFFLSLAKTYPLDPANPLSTRALIRSIRDNDRVVLFPEGRITVTGSLMKVYEGAGMIADKSGATLLPVRIEGAQYSPFSRLRGKVRMRWFPKIRVTFLPPREFRMPEALRGRARRAHAGQQLYDLMTDMVFRSSHYRKTLFDSLLDARSAHGGRHLVVEDVERRPVHYSRLVLGAFVLGRAFARNSRRGERVGLLLPNSTATVVSFFALQAYGRVPAMLNFSTGPKNVASACRTADLKTVYSSRRFVRMGRMEPVVAAILAAGVEIVYLEDLRQRISPLGKLFGLLASRFPRLAYRLTDRARDPMSPGVVLFTSGTEGAPKGVVLSHANIQANRYQVASRIDFGPGDIVFNALPMFHSFGLTAGTLLPLLSGLRTFLYPSPLHYRIVPELAYDTNATILFGTDTFLSGYARFAHPYDFYSTRYVFAGAEKLKEATRRVWSDRFGVRIFEGYGATETSPVLAMNSPMQNRAGSVGRLMPGIERRIDPVPGIERGGRLVVSGPNVMLGYLLSERPGALQPPAEGWYDTGDIVELDEDGFVFIRGRAKRFAKVAGEMVSLGAVEDLAGRVWPGFGHVVVAVADARKGEQLVLLTENPEANREALADYARAEGMASLLVPRSVIHCDRIPLLGTGKTDYVGAADFVRGELGG